jgi:hypothetical protein
MVMVNGHGQKTRRQKQTPMKYLRLIPALLLGATLTACNTTKKLYEAQEYDQVIQRVAPDICDGDMNARHINYVAASYHKANQADHERIQALKATGQPDVWPEIYQRYCSMKGRNDALKCFPTKVKNGMNYVKLDLDEDMITTDYTSVGGWVTDVMEHIPEAGETAESGIFRITAAEVNEQTVEKVIIEVLPTDEDEEDDEDDDE